LSSPQSLRHGRILALVLGLSVGVSVSCESTAWGQFSGRGGGGGGRHAGGKPSDSDSQSGYKPLPAAAPLTPHGGEYVSTETNYYEIVYMPLQTRIFLFDSKLKPLSARDVHAQMIVQLPMEKVPQQVPFQYVPMPPGVPEQDYVAAQFDIRPLEGKETSITLEFSGLSDRHYPTASFTPYYPRFSVRPYVAKVLLTEADREGIVRQQVCPVTGVPLGSRGPVVKLYIAEHPLYVSGEECLAAVKEAPQRFLPQPTMPNPGR